MEVCALRYTPKSELDQRIAKFQDCLQQKNIDGAIIIQNADLFYFTGTIQRSHLFIPAEGKPVLLVNRSLERARDESSLENIVGLSSLKEINKVLHSYGYGPFKTLGFELDILPANLLFRYQKLFAPAKIVDISPLVRTVRMIKSPYEIEIQKDVAKLHHEIYSFVKDNLREGISEMEMTGLIAVSRRKGHSGVMRIRGFNQELFFIHLISVRIPIQAILKELWRQRSRSAFAQGSSNKLIGRNEPILLDFNFSLDGYMVDQTRIFCIGTLPDHLSSAHRVAVNILKELENIAKPGITCNELYNRTMQMARDSAFEKHYLGFPRPVTFVGHGIGIELDELPVIAPGFDIPLEEGMVQP